MQGNGSGLIEVLLGNFFFIPFEETRTLVSCIVTVIMYAHQLNHTIYVI